MNRIHNWLSRIEGTSSLNEKKEILLQGTQSEDGDLLKAYLGLALDPRVTFGLTPQSLPPIEFGDGDLKASDLLSVLIDLASRDLSGNAARSTFSDLLVGIRPEQAIWALRVISKDLTIGLLARSVNDIIPGLIYTPPFMLAKPEADLGHLSFPAVASLKKNGVRLGAMLGDSGLQLITRAGHAIETFAIPAQMIQNWDLAPFQEFVLDGEATVSTGWLQDTMTILRRLDAQEGSLQMTFNPFDCIPRGEWGISGQRPYRKRMQDLVGVCRHLGLQPVSGKLVYSMAEVTEEFKRVKAEGEEGLVCKPLDGPYEPKRSFWWIKVKGFDPVDGTILQFIEGKSGKKYGDSLGSIELQDESGAVYRAAFSGTDQQRKDLWDHRDELIGHGAHFKVLAKTRSGSGQNAVFLGLSDDR